MADQCTMLLRARHDERFFGMKKNKGGELQQQMIIGFLQDGKQLEGKSLSVYMKRRTDFQLVAMKFTDPVKGGEHGKEQQDKNGGKAREVSLRARGLGIHAVQMRQGLHVHSHFI